MTPFEQAIAAGGSLVAAWDYEDNDSMRLVLYSVGNNGAKAVAETEVPTETQEAMNERLADRGVRIGGTYAGTPFVWVADEAGFAVWSDTTMTGSGKIASPAVADVNVFYSAEDRGHRGVRLHLRSGGTEVVAEQHSKVPALDITYGQDNLYYDTLWAHYLGLHLAIWHLVPLVNDISPKPIDEYLTIARAARALAKELAKAPETGPLPELAQSMGKIGRSSEMTLAVRASDDAALRRVEVDVGSPSGKSTGSLTITQGTNAQIAAFLVRVTTPSAALRAMNAIVNRQKKDAGA